MTRLAVYNYVRDHHPDWDEWRVQREVSAAFGEMTHSKDPHFDVSYIKVGIMEKIVVGIAVVTLIVSTVYVYIG